MRRALTIRQRALVGIWSAAVARIEKLEAANFVTPEGLKEQVDQLGDAIAEKLAPKIQPVINVTDKSLDERVRRLERILKSF